MTLRETERKIYIFFRAKCTVCIENHRAIYDKLAMEYYSEKYVKFAIFDICETLARCDTESKIQKTWTTEQI